MKNDERDARDLADLLRLGRLAESWIAPPAERELRELARFRAKLSNLRTGLKAQVHAVMAKNGVLPCRNDMWGLGGAAQLDGLCLPEAYEHRLDVLRDLIGVYYREIVALDRKVHLLLRHHRGYSAVQAVYGVGRVFAAIFVAEIGDVSRFPSPEALCSWAGLTPSHRESDAKVCRRYQLWSGGMDGGVILFNPTSVGTTRYRYRGTRIPSPWSRADGSAVA